MVLVGCYTPPPVAQPAIIGKYPNACLPEAITMTEALDKASIKAKVVIFKTPYRSHAICVYMYPTGANRMWGWDSTEMSNRIRAYWDDDRSIAQGWLNATSPKEDLISAEEP